MQLFAVIVLLVGVAESRSVRYDLLSLAKDAALNGGGAGAQFASLHNIAGGNAATGEVEAVGNDKDSKVGFILFGNLEDLEKYRIELNEKVAENLVNSETILNSAYANKDNSKYLKINPQTSEEKQEVDYKDKMNTQEEVEKEKLNYKMYLQNLGDFEEDEDSEDYENVNESDSNDKNRVDIFSEDEYNEYDDKYNTAEEESNEEDGSEEERFYDEDEKYYENENNKFNNQNNNEEESIFYGIFMDDS